MARLTSEFLAQQDAATLPLDPRRLTDEVLHPIWRRDIVQVFHRRARIRRGDEDVTHPRDPLQGMLLHADIVDAIEIDLFRPPANEAEGHDQALAGESV